MQVVISLVDMTSTLVRVSQTRITQEYQYCVCVCVYLSAFACVCVGSNRILCHNAVGDLQKWRKSIFFFDL